jgi:hypothetical protein
MSQNIGTLITAPIRPNDSLDPIASAYSNELLGGLHSVTSSSDRDAIMSVRRTWGMMCYVVNDDTTYQLTYNYVDNTLTNNNNWKEFTGGSGGAASTEWLDSAISATYTAPPATYSVGDRYLIIGAGSGAWSGNTDKVTEYKSSPSLGWYYTEPTDNTALRIDNQDNAVYRYEGVYPSGQWAADRANQILYVTTTTSDAMAYSGTVLPVLNYYTKDTIYLVQPILTNVGPVTIDVNALGAVNVKKDNGSGSLVDLDAGEFKSGIIYNLTFDGSYFQAQIAPNTLPAPDKFTISALGTNSYVGTASPTLGTYSAGHIYLVDFEYSNTSSVVSLDIDSLGPIDLIKFDETGPVPLVADDLEPGQIYYLVYDGSNFQVNTSDPAAAPVSYTNLAPVPTTMGGISAGTTFSNTSMQQMWTMLLYPYQVANFTGFSIGGAAPATFEVGYTISAGTYSFVWSESYPANVTNSITLRDISSSKILLTGTANDFNAAIGITYSIRKTVATSHVWRVSGTRTNGTPISRDVSSSWRWRLFYGATTSTSPTASGVQSLSNQSLATTFAGTYNFTNGGYKYVGYPSAFGNVTLFKDFNTNLSIAMADASDGYTSVQPNGLNYKSVNITNVHGVTTGYKLFRTKNILGGTISIVVS